jgi:hypothetical protein
VASNLPRRDASEEGNLLIEAISLLIERQRETESWVAEQLSQAEERTEATDRRQAELDSRLTALQDQLSRLMRELGASRAEAAVDQRLARLREQLEDLRSQTEPRPVRSTSPGGVTSLDVALARRQSDAQRPSPPPPEVAAPARVEPEARSGPDGASQPPRAVTIKAPASKGDRSLWALMGPTPQHRFGLVLIGVGVLALLYAILSQVHV